ncbi:hypothetical protein PYCCODRAFT_1435424 [Trametes coccinea BRFM310]|uniref:Uncharacterized protein n=1 Tax=Trametes coccinea (strain BRFM310) TaxID=1353009 RepID=A0A1Y2IMT2_TRAC3|nr:hypothetical protein PYCCODRAFT_1435424 [Trametes coccinea BRFM310]
MGFWADIIYAHDFGRYCTLYLRLMTAVPDAPPQWVNKVARNAVLSNGEVALHYLEETDFSGDNLHIDGTEGMAHPQSQQANFISRYEQCWKCVWDALGQDPELLECWYKVAT